MAFRNRGMYAVAEVHLPPPGRTEFPHPVEPRRLGGVGRLLGPGFVECLEAVLVPHRSRQTEAGFDLELARVAGPTRVNQFLDPANVMIGEIVGLLVNRHPRPSLKPCGNSRACAGKEYAGRGVGKRLEPQ